jgi:transposase
VLPDRLDNSFNLSVASPLLEWLPNESLYSLVSRQHCLSGSSLPEQTSRQYFGRFRHGAHHDLPSHLEQFVKRTQGALGNVNAISKQRTLLAYYLAFMTDADLQNAIACMANGSVAHLKLRLGILTSRFRANHPLKACPECMVTDRAKHGWSYWHLQHQFPGVWVCPIHGVPLRESLLKSSGVERFSWQLPASDAFRADEAWHELFRSTPNHPIKLLSDLVIQIVDQAGMRPLDAAHLLDTYRLELLRRQWLTPNGNLRVPEMASSFVDHCKLLRDVAELNALPATHDESKTQLGRLLRTARGGTHPLRHLVLIHWLFGTSESFWRAYAEASNAKEVARNALQETSQSRSVLAEDPRHAKLIQLISAENLSCRQAASKLGIDVGTAMTWAGQAGLQIARRPKKLTPILRKNAIAALGKGADKSEVATQAGVSIVTVTKLLLTEVGLHASWQQARHKKAQNHARKAWQRLLARYRHLGVKYMRSIEPATYAWLYRNDRSWLEEQTPPELPRTRVPGAPRIAWDERDKAISAQVERAVLSLYEQHQSSIRLWQIYQIVPELKAKLSVLERLPLTRRAIDRALGRFKATPPTQRLLS